MSTTGDAVFRLQSVKKTVIFAPSLLGAILSKLKLAQLLLYQIPETQEKERYMKEMVTSSTEPMENHSSIGSLAVRFLWNVWLKTTSKFFIRLKAIGDWKEVYRKNPKLIIISNHASHIDAVSVSGTIPFALWRPLYIAAAKDYFFGSRAAAFFSKYCLGALPIDRKEKKKESVEMVKGMLRRLDRMWLVIFPEGTRSKDGKLGKFKKGVSIFSQETNTPLLFCYIEGNSELWPKGSMPKPGLVKIHIGPVHPPAPIEEIEAAYRAWAKTINPEIETLPELPLAAAQN